jgi:hypothetical protein
VFLFIQKDFFLRVNFLKCITTLVAEENIMPQSTHSRVAELHDLAAHAHAAAATAHGKSDHLTAHELSQQAHEHSMNALKLSQELAGGNEK